ncbi:hypothetical protein ACQ4PT_004400 [Festuca glaucescens]
MGRRFNDEAVPREIEPLMFAVVDEDRRPYVRLKVGDGARDVLVLSPEEIVASLAPPRPLPKSAVSRLSAKKTCSKNNKGRPRKPVDPPIRNPAPLLPRLLAREASTPPRTHADAGRRGRVRSISGDEARAATSFLRRVSPPPLPSPVRRLGLLPDCLCAMSWRIPFLGSQQQQQQPEPNFQDISTQSWYPPSVVGSSSHPSTPTSSSASTHQRASDHPQSSSRGQPSPAEAAGIIARLKDKSYVTSLGGRHCNLQEKIWKGSNGFQSSGISTPPLQVHTSQLVMLFFQCTIIRTTELATAEDRLADLERQKNEIMRSYSPAALLDKLQSTMAKLDEESEELHQKFLEKDIDLPTFVQKYKKLRAAHHKCSLLHLAGTTSLH